MGVKARKKINSDMLQLARDYRKLSQTELAKRVRVTQAAISKIESGITQEISDELLMDICSTLDFPREFFLQDETVTNIGSSALYNRGRKKITVSDMKWIEANINLYRWHVKKLLHGLAVNNPKTLPGYNIEEGSAISAARKLRAYWKLPSGPIKNLTKLVEDAGVIIIPVDFGTPHLDGTCMWLADGPPLIFVGKNLPADRYRWTICHELGHLVMHSEPRETQEQEADTFAAEFLMPAEEMKYEFRTKLSLQKFSELKYYWLVSMAALVRRALDLRQMNERQYRYYNINLSRLGYPEPIQFKKEVPSAWKELIEYHLNDLGYSEEEFQSLLLAPKDFINRLPNKYQDKPKLMLVQR
jgi:Zn-dependent peptidase ImmA (M78 family)/DNA-binding XRE family transcriptional regulator